MAYRDLLAVQPQYFRTMRKPRSTGIKRGVAEYLMGAPGKIWANAVRNCPHCSLFLDYRQNLKHSPGAWSTTGALNFERRIVLKIAGPCKQYGLGVARLLMFV